MSHTDSKYLIWRSSQILNVMASSQDRSSTFKVFYLHSMYPPFCSAYLVRQFSDPYFKFLMVSYHLGPNPSKPSISLSRAKDSWLGKSRFNIKWRYRSVKKFWLLVKNDTKHIFCASATLNSSADKTCVTICSLSESDQKQAWFIFFLDLVLFRDVSMGGLRTRKWWL